ncbi:adenosine deaminase [Sediminibacillus massiliensis]|uniref:adenosine deaminase n=1 Tax=Sediminibacillus massiliensis TaxID=1926277 RepID=UPI0009883A47|nr:adenosine deaminase [Sediminibacillus massiliensis]
MNGPLIDNWIKEIPKVDLHLHLDGSLNPKTVLELAEISGIPLPATTEDRLRPYLQIDEDCNSLRQYLTRFEIVLPLLQTKYALERAAYEMVAQVSVQNCIYIEVRFGPQLHREKGLSLPEILEAVLMGLKRGEAEFGVTTGLIACCLRHHDKNANLDVIDASKVYIGKGLAGVDLAGDEASFPPLLFKQIFLKAEQCGLPITIHAGEAGGADNIYHSVHALHANRIGHGIRLREDDSLLNLMREKQIPLEMCPVSNIQTKTCAGWKDYPVRDYFDYGLPVTINTDNLTVSNTTISREYQILHEKYGFDKDEMVQLVLNGINAAFVDKEQKALLVNRFLETAKNINMNESL